jgi:uncharacterized repeat protein (TIGR01451 family)
MRFGRWLPALFALAATAAALLMLAGAGAAANGPDLSSTQAIDAYLQSIGVDPATAVRQNTSMNWAGPGCPGKPWNCANGKVIVQAAAGATNRVTGCTVSTADTQLGCVIVQFGTNNNAQCLQTTLATQSCVIAQSGAQNVAVITQQIAQKSGANQTGLQTADLSQTATVSNKATVGQSINQSTKDGTSQSQNAHQSFEGLQNATTGSATNNLQVGQAQNQVAQSGMTQNQNADASGVTDCYTNAAVETPANPNACANIEQSSVGGANESHLRQAEYQDANSGGVATQQQGTPSGGLEARVHQETTSGSQLNDANQAKKQHQSAAPGSSQTQYDPVFCCGVGSQVGGTGTESISQANSQDATGAGANQQSDLIGVSLTPNGTCTIKQSASNNADSANNSETESPCPFLLLETSCSNGSESGSCTASEPVTTPPGNPDSSVTKLVRNVTAGETQYSPTTDVGVGSTVEYQITYMNAGNGTAHSVSLTDALPLFSQNVSCTGGCTTATDPNTGGTIATWSLGDMPAGSQQTVTLTASVCGNTTNTVVADSTEETPTSSSATPTGSCLQ